MSTIYVFSIDDPTNVSNILANWRMRRRIYESILYKEIFIIGHLCCKKSRPFRKKPSFWRTFFQRIDLGSALVTLSGRRKYFRCDGRGGGGGRRHRGAATSTPWRSKPTVWFYHWNEESIAVEYRNEQKRNFHDTMTRFRATRIPREQVRNSLHWSG